MCQLKGSTVREFLSCGTHPKQERQEVDSQENITLVTGKTILIEIMEHNSE